MFWKAQSPAGRGEVGSRSAGRHPAWQVMHGGTLTRFARGK